MLDQINIENVLFLDIETVPVYPDYKSMPDIFKPLWDIKSKYIQKEGETDIDIYRKAGIYAEFGKIICISVGLVKKNGKDFSIRIKSFSGDDEKLLLSDFCELLKKHYNRSEHLLCAHNGKEFDFPYLARRILINGLKLPFLLNIAGKKPWEVQHLDTLELWKFGDYKNYTSLNLLAAVFDIPTPKDDINGSDVARVYWEEKNLNRIVTYCQKDVLTIAQLLLRYKGEPLIEETSTFFV